MSNCSSYGFNQGIEVCVDGAVGNGNTARLDVWLADSPRVYFFGAAPLHVGHVNNWDGSAVHFSGFTYSSWGGCDVTSSRITVELVADNTVNVGLEIGVNNCTSGDIYNACGGSGPFTISDSFTAPLSLGAPCNGGVASGP
ncbi:MAG: hypothetical protein WAL83_00705 [Arenicellales bacterium]